MKFVEPNVEQYAIDHSDHPSHFCDRIQALTHQFEDAPQMLIGPMEASVLGFLLRLTGAKRVLEIGTFTGYSALAMAEQLGADGEVITLDISERHARPEYLEVYKDSAHFSKIRFIKGNALETMKELQGNFDLIFIDADKSNYEHYLNCGLEFLSDNGVIVVDNILWSGEVLKPVSEINQDDESTLALKRLAEVVAKRDDLYKTMLPIRDGILLIQKK